MSELKNFSTAGHERRARARTPGQPRSFKRVSNLSLLSRGFSSRTVDVVDEPRSSLSYALAAVTPTNCPLPDARSKLRLLGWGWAGRELVTNWVVSLSGVFQFVSAYGRTVAGVPVALARRWTRLCWSIFGTVYYGVTLDEIVCACELGTCSGF